MLRTTGQMESLFTLTTVSLAIASGLDRPGEKRCQAGPEPHERQSTDRRKTMPLSDDEIRILDEARMRAEREHQEFQAQQEAAHQARIAEEQARRAAEQPHSGPTW
ncbi:hypothetical protein [Streptomyces tendae]|uniref:hypothetical protein n=1 Tax=Streptomyces tendae TaxID=1932 RepID=UPI0037110042